MSYPQSAGELTFGIEIETVAPFGVSGLQIGSYHHGVQVPYLPPGWTAQSDGSIRATNGLACEIVSPILKGREGLAEAVETINKLREQGHRVNDSCGTHVHVGWPRTIPSDKLAKLIKIVAYAERGLYAVTGTKTREIGVYCGGVRKYGNDKLAKQALDRARYHALNLTNLANNRRDTVEFRVFGGSLNPVKVTGWVQACLGLVEKALVCKRTPSWSPGTLKGGWAKKGPGQSEAERLMGFLGWGEGYAKAGGGRMFGWLASLADQEAVKAEFRRLAKKYDGEA